jgi:hypothetical protein
MLDFVRICLHKNPSQRPDSSMISSHQFIRQDVSALRDIHSDESRKGGLPAIRSLLQKMGAKVDDVLSTRANSSSDDGKREVRKRPPRTTRLGNTITDIFKQF